MAKATVKANQARPKPDAVWDGACIMASTSRTNCRSLMGKEQEHGGGLLNPDA